MKTKSWSVSVMLLCTGIAPCVGQDHLRGAPSHGTPSAGATVVGIQGGSVQVAAPPVPQDARILPTSGAPRRLPPVVGVSHIEEFDGPSDPTTSSAMVIADLPRSVVSDGEALIQSAQPNTIPRQVPSSVVGSSSAVQLLPLDPIAGAADRSSLQWWVPSLPGPLLGTNDWISFDLATIVSDALKGSPRFLGVMEKQTIAWSEVVQEDAAFDARWILDSRTGRTSDPVGNTLVTGGPPRLRELDWSTELGLSRRTRLGTQWDVKQQVGLSDSNSVFFTPPNQGNSRLTISMNHPLLAGAGRLYNERLVLDARLDTDITWHDVQAELQSNLADIMVAYWRVYSARCKLLQQRSLLERGRRIQSLVNAREGFDAGRTAKLRVDERLRRIEDQLLRIQTELQNQQTRLVRNVGTRQLTQQKFGELIPRDLPVCPPVEMDVEKAFVTSLNHRPDIAIAASELEKAALEVRVTRQEILPQLNALVETYVAGLRGDWDIAQSIGDQFTQGQPGFSAGLVMDFAAGSRAARAKNRAAQAEVRRIAALMEQAIQQAREEVEIAVRDLETAGKSVRNRELALEAAVAEETFLQKRWEMLGGDSDPAGIILEDLLSIQQTRTQAEFDLVDVQVEYVEAMVRLQVAMGTLMTETTSAPDGEPENLSQ